MTSSKSIQALKIVEIRRIAGVDQRQLAEALGLAPQRLSGIERGYLSSSPDFEVRVRKAIASILRRRLTAVQKGATGRASRR